MIKRFFGVEELERRVELYGQKLMMLQNRVASIETNITSMSMDHKWIVPAKIEERIDASEKVIPLFIQSKAQLKAHTELLAKLAKIDIDFQSPKFDKTTRKKLKQTRNAEIIQAYKKNKIPLRILADVYGLHTSRIWQIVNGK